MDTVLSLKGGDVGGDLRYQMHCPGYVCLTEAEESLPMVGADSGHRAKEKASGLQACGKRTDRAGGWEECCSCPPTPPPQ